MLRFLKSTIFHWTPLFNNETMARIEIKALRNPIYRRASANAAAGAGIEDDLPTIGATLKDYRHRDWAVAAALVTLLGKNRVGEDREAAVQSLLSQVLARKQRQVFYLPMLALQFLILCLPVTFPLGTGNALSIMAAPGSSVIGAMLAFGVILLLFPIYLLPFIGTPLIAFYNRRINFVRSVAAWALGSFHDASNLITLSLAVEDSSSQVRKQARNALKELVSILPTDAYFLLDNAPSDAFCRLLRDRDTATALAALTVLERAGSDSAIHSVRWAMNNSRKHELAAAAARALPVLEERRNKTLQRDLLLRASGPASGGDILLRAAAATQSEDPAVLLRASE